MINKSINVHEVLRNILQERGNQLIKKNNGKLLCSMMRDQAPDQVKEIRLLDKALQEGVGEMLLKAVGQGKAEQQRTIMLGEKLLMDSFFSEEASARAVWTIAFALGIDNPKPVPSPSPQPSARLAPPKPEEDDDDDDDDDDWDENDAEDLLDKAMQYAEGDGVKQDFRQAVYWMRKAAELGYADAQFWLASYYEDGKGVTQDLTQAVYWYRKAAEQGDADAQYFLGSCYEDGEGVAQDLKQAVYWYRKAAEQGDAAAQYNLGYCYMEGKGVVRDKSQAVYWFQKAAEQGYEASLYNLGLCYENGYGVKGDLHYARVLYQKAADKGFQAAKNKLKKLAPEPAPANSVETRPSGSGGGTVQEKIRQACEEFLAVHDRKAFADSRVLHSRLGVPDRETVYLAHDDTLLKTGKNGFVITDGGLYCRELMEEPVFTSYQELANTSNISNTSSGVIRADGRAVAYYSGNSRMKKDLIALLQNIREIWSSSH